MVRYISINYLQQASDRMNTQAEPETGSLKKANKCTTINCQKKIDQLELLKKFWEVGQRYNDL